ncbi:hypothetical protein SCYAM73S_00022 [Streptomyces cyaneofuscatus]
MSQLRAPAARPDRREGGRHGRPGARAHSAPTRPRAAQPTPEGRIRPQLLRTALLPTIAALLSAALAAGLYSLGRSAGARFGDNGDVRQVVVELDSTLLFVSTAGSGTCLAVLAGREADAAVLGYEMAMLVKSVRPYLMTPLRQPAGAPFTPGL